MFTKRGISRLASIFTKLEKVQVDLEQGIREIHEDQEANRGKQQKLDRDYAEMARAKERANKLASRVQELLA